MAQYIVSITMGTPEFDNRDRLDQCTYNHLHQVFDDYASAKAGFRSAVSAYAEAHFGNENRIGEIFERPGRLSYIGEQFGWRKKPLHEVRSLTERLLPIRITSARPMKSDTSAKWSTWTPAT